MDNDLINDLLDEVPEGASQGVRLGVYEAQLTSDVQALLVDFVKWLVATGKTQNTANSYKSYVAKALATKQAWSDLTSDQRAAVKQFKNFVKA